MRLDASRTPCALLLDGSNRISPPIDSYQVPEQYVFNEVLLGHSAAFDIFLFDFLQVGIGGIEWRNPSHIIEVHILKSSRRYAPRICSMQRNRDESVDVATFFLKSPAVICGRKQWRRKTRFVRGHDQHGRLVNCKISRQLYYNHAAQCHSEPHDQLLASGGKNWSSSLSIPSHIHLYQYVSARLPKQEWGLCSVFCLNRFHSNEPPLQSDKAN